MRHQYYEILISAMMDNNLSEEEKSILDKHIVKCKKCQKIKREFENLSAMLNGENIDTKSADFIFTTQKPFMSVLKIAATIISIFLFGIASFVGIRQYRANDINYAVIPSSNASDDGENNIENQELTALIDDRVILTTFASYFETEEDTENNDQLFSTYFTYLDE